MKPPRFTAFARTAVCATSILALSSGFLSADTLYWDGTATTPFNWGTAANWSTTLAPAGTDPANAPGAADVAVFSSSGVTAAQVINLNANQSVLGIATTTDNSGQVNIYGGTGDFTLSIGASGINHTRGGLVFGSSTTGPGQVNISLLDSQTWNSSTVQPGTGTLVAINVWGTVSNGSATSKVLTLDGINTGTAIHGNVIDGAGSLRLVKAGGPNSVWTLNGAANNITGGVAVDTGTLVLSNNGTYGPVSVAGGATLRLGNGFTGAQIAALSNGATFATGSTLSLNNASTTISDNLSGNYNLVKLGGNTLTLSGTNTYTGTTTIEAGNIIVETTASLATFGTAGATVVTGTGGLIATLGGATGFTVADFEQLRTNTTFGAGTLIGMSIATGSDIAYRGEFGGTGNRFIKTGGGTLVLQNASTYTGNTAIQNGTAVVSSFSAIGDGGLIQVGSGTNVTRLRYTGVGETISRNFQIGASTGSTIIESSGSGGLVLNGTLTGTSGSKTLTLTGTNRGTNVFGGNLANYGTSTSTGVLKTGSGSWTLSGNNTHTGNTRVNSGSLILDYSGGNNPVSTGNVQIQGGNLIFKGAATGVTAKTVSSLQVGVGNYGAIGIVLDANGGSGFQLTATTLQGTTSAQHHDLFDFSSSAGNSLAVGTLGATMAVTNGVLMNNNGATSSRASLIVRDTTGYGFATINNGFVQRLSTFNDLTTGSVTINDAVQNFRMAAGNYTTTGNAVFNTLTFDSSAGAVNLTMGSGHILSAGTIGKGALFTGTNNVTISGGPSGGIGTGSALWYHNYLSGGAALNLQASLGNSQTILFGGSGLTNYSGAGIGADLVLNGGVFRMTRDQALGSTVNIRVNNSTVFEVGADLNGPGTAHDFTKGVGDGGGTVSFYGDSGLSAYTAEAGGTRVVEFSTGDLTWGAGRFLTYTDGTDGDYAFRLSSTTSNATIQINNNIALAGRSRRVEVANGSADVDAVLAGSLSGSVASDLMKSGAGTLSLTGTNSYAGKTVVDGGRLIVSGGGLTATTQIDVRNSTLELASVNVLNNSADITLENATLIARGGGTEAVGTLTIIGDNQLNLVAAGNAIAFANSSGEVWSSTLAILNWTGMSGGNGANQVFFGSNAGGLTTDQLAKITFVNPNLNGQQLSGVFGAEILSTGEIVAIPEPSMLMLLAGAPFAALVRRRRVK